MYAIRSYYADEADEVEVPGVHRRHALHAQDLPLRIGGDQVGEMDPAGQAVGPDRDGGHQVEAQQRQVVEVVARERFALEVGVDAAQAAQAAAPAREVVV